MGYFETPEAHAAYVAGMSLEAYESMIEAENAAAEGNESDRCDCPTHEHVKGSAQCPLTPRDPWAEEEIED